MNLFISTYFRSGILIAASLIAGIHPVLGNVLMQIGATTGGNNQLSSAKSYTYNFGITSAAAGLNLNQIVLGVGRQNGVTEGITVEIYPAFGGAASGQAPISSTFFAANTFPGAQRTNYTLELPELNLAPGAYSIRITSNTPSNASYAFTDGLLTLGGAVSESQWIQDSNTGGTAGTSIAPSAGYLLADRAVSTNDINLGRFHLGNSAAQSAVVTLTNSAPASSGNVTESLSVSQGAVSEALSLSSLPSNAILQGASYQVGISLSAVAGSQNGSV